MNKFTMETLVGLVVVTALFILGYYTIILSEREFKETDFYTIEVIFPHANGLKKGDIVSVLGVSAGEVESVELKQNSVWVKLRMFNKFNMYENYSLSIRSAGAIGDKYVDVYPGIEKIDDKMYAQIGFETPLIGTRSGDIIAVIEDLIAKNEDAFGESLRNMQHITSEVKTLSYKMNTQEGALGRLLLKESTLKDADELLTEVKETVEDSREQAPVTSFIRAALTAF